MTDQNLNVPTQKATDDAVAPVFRALSLLQPWAWCVLYGPKNIENRTWWADIRGPVWVHSSAQVTPGYYRRACETIAEITRGELVVPPLDELVRGAMLGRITIGDCILPGGYRSEHKLLRGKARSFYTLQGPKWGDELRKGGAKIERHPLRANRWHFVDQYGYVIEERDVLTVPVPCAGHQKSWRMKPELIERVRAVPFVHAGLERAARGIDDALRRIDAVPQLGSAR